MVAGEEHAGAGDFGIGSPGGGGSRSARAAFTGGPIHDDPDGLTAAPAERDQHGLTCLEGAELGRHEIGIGAGTGPAGCVDRDLDA